MHNYDLCKALHNRKKYLFTGSEAGAERAAILYSLVASCKLHDHDPFVYFRDVLRRISTHPAEQIDDLLPCHWQPPAPETDANNLDKAQIVKIAS